MLLLYGFGFYFDYSYLNQFWPHRFVLISPWSGMYAEFVVIMIWICDGVYSLMICWYTNIYHCFACWLSLMISCVKAESYVEFLFKLHICVVVICFTLGFVEDKLQEEHMQLGHFMERYVAVMSYTWYLLCHTIFWGLNEIGHSMLHCWLFNATGILTWVPAFTPTRCVVILTSSKSLEPKHNKLFN